MSTPSLLLSCAGASASLAGVWSLAGLSERSPLRASPRALAATGVGLLAEGAAYVSAPAAFRVDLALPLLFATAGVLALGVGSAKVDAALAEKDGPRVVRRTAGIVAGSFFAMAAVGAASLDLGQSSLLHARLGWSFLFAVVAGAMVVFLQRTRYAGAGLLTLGHRAWLLGLIVVALLVGAGLTRSSAAREPSPPPSRVAVAPAAAPPAPPVAVATASASPEAPAAPTPPADASAVPSVTGVVVDAVTVRGMQEEDARGGVTLRKERLDACLTDPANQQTGALVVKVGIDASGSVADSRPLSGDLVSAPLGACLVRALYKMGFPAPPSGSASFDITLRVGAP
jgi:hypothetical protein